MGPQNGSEVPKVPVRCMWGHRFKPWYQLLCLACSPWQVCLELQCQITTCTSDAQPGECQPELTWENAGGHYQWLACTFPRTRDPIQVNICKHCSQSVHVQLGQRVDASQLQMPHHKYVTLTPYPSYCSWVDPSPVLTAAERWEKQQTCNYEPQNQPHTDKGNIQLLPASLSKIIQLSPASLY